MERRWRPQILFARWKTRAVCCEGLELGVSTLQPSVFPCSRASRRILMDPWLVNPACKKSPPPWHRLPSKILSKVTAIAVLTVNRTVETFRPSFSKNYRQNPGRISCFWLLLSIGFHFRICRTWYNDNMLLVRRYKV